jgi:hypothetical protein
LGDTIARRLHAAIGFERIDEFPALWGRDNPCPLLVKPLKAAG